MAPAEPHWKALRSREEAEVERLDLVLLVRVAMVMLLLNVSTAQPSNRKPRSALGRINRPPAPFLAAP
jgi:hypothetical protein